MSELKVFLKKGKLPSDNQIAPHLKAYSIARDLQSDYIFNGKFMFMPSIAILLRHIL